MKKMLFAFMLSLTVLVVLAPLSFANPPGFDDKEIRIGMFGPQTGPAAPWGSVARGSALLMTIVNEEGGIHGRKIKSFVRDDMYNPAQTKTVVKELVERQGIFAFVGGVGAARGIGGQGLPGPEQDHLGRSGHGHQRVCGAEQSLPVCRLSAV